MLKHVKLFEEIGFSYAGKEEKKDDPITAESPLSISTIERSYRKVAKSAFEAGRNSTESFEEWWGKIWGMGLSSPQKKTTLAKKPIGFKSFKD